MATNPAAPQYEGESEDAAKGSTSPPSTPRGASPTDEVDPNASGSVAKGAASAAPIRDENLDDSDPGASAAANPQRSGVAVLSMAAAFDTAVPEEVVNANYNQFRARELHDPLAGMTDGSGSLRNFFLFMQGVVDENGNPRTEDGNDDDDGMSDYIEAANDRDEQRHARDEWARSEHEYAGVEMTGAEWGELSDMLSNDSPLRKWLVSRIKQKTGKSEADANAEADQVALLARMQSIPKDQWTVEMVALDRQLEADPAKKAELNGYLHDTVRDGYASTRDLGQTATNAGRDASVSESSDLLDCPTGNQSSSSRRLVSVAATTGRLDNFAGAVDLTEEHRRAVAATVPLDAPKPLPQPVAVASAPAPGGGFDA